MGQHTPGKVLAISRPELSWALLALLLLRWGFSFPSGVGSPPKIQQRILGQGWCRT